MNEQSAFNQKHVESQAYSETSGLLEQMNLPPGAIRFIRNNKKTLQISAAVVIVLSIGISLYNSYRHNRLEKAASSLDLALSAKGEEKAIQLQQVVDQFSGTPSALWAMTELGHQAMRDSLYKLAGERYSQVREKISQSNPMYGLLTFGIAQANEAGKNFQAASAAYTTLKDIPGYKDEGYRGLARVLEAKGDAGQALAVYEEYLGSLLGDGADEQKKKIIEEKITRLQVAQ